MKRFWLLVVVGLLAGTTLSFGQSSSSDTALNGCVKKRTGALRVLKSGKRCRSSERKLTWNRRGATGPRGKAGATGARGPSGSAGAQGSMGDQGSRGTFDFGDFDGMPCARTGGDGTIELTYTSAGFASFQC